MMDFPGKDQQILHRQERPQDDSSTNLSNKQWCVHVGVA